MSGESGRTSGSRSEGLSRNKGGWDQPRWIDSGPKATARPASNAGSSFGIGTRVQVRSGSLVIGPSGAGSSPRFTRRRVFAEAKSQEFSRGWVWTVDLTLRVRLFLMRSVRPTVPGPALFAQETSPTQAILMSNAMGARTMPDSPAATLVDRLRRVARPDDPRPDGELLAEFI